ncbi:MAG: hypothetical protein HOC27_08080 [Phycisphaerae bacterium]|nr:hypothetical protein [Phycisphaerae bacterium]
MMKSFIVSAILSTTPNSFLQTAQQNISDKNWSEAVENYNLYMREVSEPNPELMFDLGVALYRDGQFELATTTFSDVIIATEDPKLQLSSAYNLGNSIFQLIDESASSEDQEVPKIEYENAMKLLHNAIEHYRNAINNEELNDDARANAEVVWQLAKMIEKRESEQQKQQQNDQQQQEQSEDSADQQKDDSSQSQEQKDDGSSEQEQQKKDSENSEENQQKDGKQSQEGEDQKQDGKPSDEQKDAQDTSNADGDQQKNKDKNGEPKPLEDMQEGELKTSEDDMNQPKDGLKNVKDKGERLSEAQADRLLQLIRDKEQQRQKKLAARREANRTSDGKDW